MDDDEDSLFGGTNFLSFEEWKKGDLARSGQSVETVGQGRTVPAPDRSRPGIDNSLEGLGEDNEIELDFSGFGGPANVPVRDIPGSHGQGSTTSDAAKEASPSSMPRSRDAGKTGKTRSNYASFDCAANILKTNSQCTHSSAILVENKDSYMLNKCAADSKFIIVELCDDILIDTIVLANFEFFSSTFRTFKVSVSDKYPVKVDRWRELGIFEARNSRDIQAFLVENPLIWARYLRIEFVTHYGSEYYCPVSLLRVHGTTMMAEFRHQEELARGEVDNDDEEEVAGVVNALPTPIVPAQIEKVTLDSKTTASAPAKVYEPIFEQPIIETVSPESSSLSQTAYSTSNPVSVADPQDSAVHSNSGREASMSISIQTRQDGSDPTFSGEASPTYPADLPGYVTPTSSANMASRSSEPSIEADKSPSTSSTPISSHESRQSTSSTKPSMSPSSLSATSTTSSFNKAPSASTASSSPSTPPPATQESFFKSIHKRLQFLESNATLSLQYIESQYLQFREAFGRVERRNLARTSTFLEALNATVSAELAHFKSEYEQLWQSTVLELSSQREENRKEAALMADRYTMLAEELVSQKRLIAVQATLLLLCLGLIIFSRFMGGGGGSSGVDPGLVHLVNELVPGARRTKDGGMTRRGASPRWEGAWTPTSPTVAASSPRDASTEDEAENRDGKDDAATIREEDEDDKDDGDVELMDFESTARLTKSAPVTPRTEAKVELRLMDNETEDGLSVDGV